MLVCGMETRQHFQFDKAEFKEKKDRLDRVRQLLKDEFHGIDEVIDQVLDAISGWYCFNALQNKPLVINLWGLTGTGKTSLVKRLVKMLELENVFFKYDMRNSTAKQFGEICDSLHKKFNEKPFVLILDEFQQGKSLDEEMKSHANEHQTKIWELLDTGEISLDFKYGTVENLLYQMERCEQILAMGVDIVGGRIKFKKKLKQDPSQAKPRSLLSKRLYFSTVQIDNGDYLVQESYYDDIRDLSDFETENQVRDHMESLDGPQTYAFLNELLKTAFKPREINATKGLIFVAGNLDEAYRMSSRLSGEESADDFYTATRKISLYDIKRALSLLFRKEQISRLGNIHVIYPSLNKKAYEQIIENELASINHEFKSLTGLHLEYESTIKVKIYEEGVIPSQGTRPLFSVIQYMVRAYLPRILDEIMSKDFPTTHLLLGYAHKKVTIKYQQDGKVVYESAHAFISNLEAMRELKNTDDRYVVAVHEAGHLLACICLLNQIPKRATSISTSGSMEGFVVLEQPKSYFHKDVVNWIALNLAGGVAEKLVFGDDHLPMGSFVDYSNATRFIINLLKEGQLHDVPAIYKHPDVLTDSYLSDHGRSFDQEAEKWILKGQRACVELLQARERELLELADRLLKVNYMEEQEILAYAQQKLGWKASDLEQGKGVYAAFFERRKSQLLN